MDLGALGFWLAVGAIVVASIIAPKLEERERLRVLRAALEKNGTIDPQLLETFEKERAAARAANEAMMMTGAYAPSALQAISVTAGIMMTIGAVVLGVFVTIAEVRSSVGYGPDMIRLATILSTLALGWALCAAFATGLYRSGTKPPEGGRPSNLIVVTVKVFLTLAVLIAILNAIALGGWSLLNVHSVH